MPNPYEGRIKYRTWEKVGRGLKIAGLTVALSGPVVATEALIEKGVTEVIGSNPVEEFIGPANDRFKAGLWGSVFTVPAGLLFGDALGSIIEGQAKRMQYAPQRDTLNRLGKVIEIWERIELRNHLASAGDIFSRDVLRRRDELPKAPLRDKRRKRQLGK